MAHGISSKLNKLWVFSEVILFSLVGAQVNLHVALDAGLKGSILIFVALIARSIGTYVCLLGSDLNPGERLFVIISYLPKATVQAAIGGAPLLAMKTTGMDTGPGEIILAVAVLSILLTAPLGAWLITIVGEKVLDVEAFEKKKAAIGDVSENFQELFKVGQLMETDVPLLKETANIRSVLDYFATNKFLICPTVNDSGGLQGIILLDDVKVTFNKEHIWEVVLAHDIIHTFNDRIVPEDTLKDALLIADANGMQQIPVVNTNGTRLEGILDIRSVRQFIEEKSLEYMVNSHSK